MSFHVPDLCTKIPYGTQAEARSLTKRHRNRGGSKLRVYRCPVCSCWHVGHSDRKRG